MLVKSSALDSAACCSGALLVPEDTLQRRSDGVEAEGYRRRLTAKTQGQGHSKIAAAFGRVAPTVWGGLRSFALRARAILEPSPARPTSSAPAMVGVGLVVRCL